MLTARDAAALRFVGEQYAVRDDVLRSCSAGCPPPSPRRTGCSGRERYGSGSGAGSRPAGSSAAGCSATPVLPTRTGLRLAGLQFDPWEPAESRLAHHHAVALVRLHREAAPGQSGVGVRAGAVAPSRQGELASVRQRPPAPVPAGWQGISEAWELVEVELTQKARPRVVAALKTRPPHTAAITYYVPASLHAPLSTLLASVVRELGGRPPVAVELLPQVPGVSYLPVRGDAG